MQKFSVFRNSMPDPSAATWRKPEDISRIFGSLRFLGSWRVFFMGGWTELTYSRPSHEFGCIEFGETATVLNPKTLDMRIIHRLNMPVFRLTCDKLDPIGTGLGGYPYEEVTELLPGEYADYMCYDEREYKGEPLPPSARPLFRYTDRAPFLIVPKDLDKRPYRMVLDRFEDYDNLKELMVAFESIAQAIST